MKKFGKGCKPINQFQKAKADSKKVKNIYYYQVNKLKFLNYFKRHRIKLHKFLQTEDEGPVDTPPAKATKAYVATEGLKAKETTGPITKAAATAGAPTMAAIANTERYIVNKIIKKAYHG